MLHIAPSLLSRHPHGRWPDGSPVKDVANLLDIQYRVGVLVRCGDLDGAEIIYSNLYIQKYLDLVGQSSVFAD